MVRITLTIMVLLLGLAVIPAQPVDLGRAIHDKETVEPTPTATETAEPTPTVTLTPESTVTPSITPRSGDLTGDGVVNINDLFELLRQWHRQAGK